MHAHDNASALKHPVVPGVEQVRAATDFFRMLSDPTRVRILWQLGEGEHDVTSLAAAVGVARPAVSQHLAKLRLVGLVDSRRDGRRALYRARGGHVRRLLWEALGAADHQLAGVPDE